MAEVTHMEPGAEDTSAYPLARRRQRGGYEELSLSVPMASSSRLLGQRAADRWGSSPAGRVGRPLMQLYGTTAAWPKLWTCVPTRISQDCAMLNPYTYCDNEHR